jgi:hypothetical protein
MGEVRVKGGKIKSGCWNTMMWLRSLRTIRVILHSIGSSITRSSMPLENWSWIGWRRAHFWPGSRRQRRHLPGHRGHRWPETAAYTACYNYYMIISHYFRDCRLMFSIWAAREPSHVCCSIQLVIVYCSCAESGLHCPYFASCFYLLPVVLTSGPVFIVSPATAKPLSPIFALSTSNRTPKED